jgi:hypothetical protein
LFDYIIAFLSIIIEFVVEKIGKEKYLQHHEDHKEFDTNNNKQLFTHTVIAKTFDVKVVHSFENIVCHQWLKVIWLQN